MEVWNQEGRSDGSFWGTSLMNVRENSTKDAAWCGEKRILETWVWAWGGPLHCCVSPGELLAPPWLPFPPCKKRGVE